MVFISNSEYKNRYTLPFSNNLSTNDKDAYFNNPKHNFVYNKHYVMKSQGVQCGSLDILPNKYPVFVKPEINLRGGNRGCFKVNNDTEFLDIKNKYQEVETIYIKEMFWSTFIEGEEGSTDFVVKNGIIKYELDYKIKKLPDSIIGVETLVSKNNKCPSKVRRWIRKNIPNYCGIVNLQYIGDTIIEVGLRPDAGGRFIQWTGNEEIIKNINYFTETGEWLELPSHYFDFNDKYVIGCYKDYPIVYYLPSSLIANIMRENNVENWHHYIDVQKTGKKYLNIVGENRDNLIRVKKYVEKLTNILNTISIIFFILLIGCIYIHFFVRKLPNSVWVIMSILLMLYLTRFINPQRYAFNYEF